MIYVVFRFLKRHKTWSIIAILAIALGLGISRFHRENTVFLYNYDGEEISFFTSVKAWLRGDLEAGIMEMNVMTPKVIRLKNESPTPPINDVVKDVLRFDPELKLIFHKKVQEKALVALFWNENNRRALIYAFPQAHVYAEHETSAPDLSTALAAYDVNVEINLQTFHYDPHEGFSSFQKRDEKQTHRIQGARIVTLKPEHGPLESWGFGTRSNSSDEAKLTFFIGYDKSEKRWRAYEFHVQHGDGRSRRDWEMQEFDFR